MTDPKQKHPSSLRQPKPKKSLGLSVPPPLRMPHEELVTPIEHIEEATMTSMPSQTSSKPVAPVKDFSKVANSIAREAIPSGIFKGKSKQLYDYLYSVTRGAIVPSRTVRLSRPKLMKATGIGSPSALDANVVRLKEAGLVSVRSIVGEHEGNEYTVYIPEEISTPSTTSITSNTSSTEYTHKQDILVLLETSNTRYTLSTDNPTNYIDPKTSFKTHDDDDDGITDFWRVIAAAARQALGGDLPKTEVERERWRECGAVLAEELIAASARAGAVSSIPAFFAAHLRRQFKVSKGREEPRRDLNKTQARALSIEQRILKMIKELRALHVGDPEYQESDLIDDLKFKCERDGIAWNEELREKFFGQGKGEG